MLFSMVEIKPRWTKIQCELIIQVYQLLIVVDTTHLPLCACLFVNTHLPLYYLSDSLTNNMFYGVIIANTPPSSLRGEEVEENAHSF